MSQSETGSDSGLSRQNRDVESAAVESESESEGGAQSDQGDGDELKHIFIRRGLVMESFSELSDPDSIESELARSRGGGELVSFDTDTRDGGSSTSTVKLEEGRLQSDTGFFMHFVDEEKKELFEEFNYDLVSLTLDTAYPVSEKTLDSLPQWAQEKLERQDELKINAMYDSNGSIFYSVQEGWGRERNHLDELIQLTEDLDGDLVSAAYYLASKYGSEEFRHPKTIAEARDIKPESVKESIRKVKNEIE